MPGSAAQQANAPAAIQRALTLLTEALALIDAIDVRPEIGARLQEVIEALRKEHE